jgi:hypothetical protein
LYGDPDCFPSSTINWPPEDRAKLLNTLDSVERVLSIVYRLLMLLIIAAVGLASGWVFIDKSLGPGNQGEYFYFAVLALFVFGWALSSVVQASQRQKRIQLPKVRVETKVRDDGRAWKLAIGPMNENRNTGNHGPEAEQKQS